MSRKKKAPSIKHVSWRDGRPRFTPGVNVRALGHKSKDLRHDDGRWFSRGEALDWSEKFEAALLEAATAKPARIKKTRPAVPATSLYTVARLFEDWFRSPKFSLPKDEAEMRRQRQAKIVLSPKSIVWYKEKSRIIENHDPSLWASPVDALTQPICFGLYEELVSARGLAGARGALATFSVALAWGRKRGKFNFRMNQGVNPAKGLGMSTPPPRIRFATRAEITALVEAADAMKWPELGDMITLGVWTGQRQNDRLLLVDKGLMNGRRIFKQSKTAAIVAIREAPQLKARLAASRERRKQEGVVSPRVVLNELYKPWAPFPDDGDHYRKRYAKLREIAANGIENKDGSWKVKPAPTLLGDKATGLPSLLESDLRDTSVTWMALAGSTIPEIVAITGHTLDSATRILRHYLARHPEMGDSAIGKMMEWYDADGETEIGF